MPAWERILIHHSGARDTNGADWQAIARYHVQQRGWRAVGYHALVELYGGQYLVFDGRPTTMPGAHCPGQNELALGLCLVGDYSELPPPESQVRAAAEKCARWCAEYGISPDEIRPHRDFRATICPGEVPVDEIRRLTAELLFEEGGRP